MRYTLVSLALIVCTFGKHIENITDIKSTLEILHVVFRHGDRTPDSLYPKDPYTEETFFPIRIGHLTNKGKMTAFKIGTALRNRYDAFIPNVYTPEIIQSISSHVPRTRASLELVLAGLFPPTNDLRWNDKLKWEPIPYDYLQPAQNKLFMPLTACPHYGIVAKNATATYSDPTEIKYKSLLPFLQESSGLQFDNVITIGAMLYSTLKSEDELGLTLPSWTKDVYPEIISELAAHAWLISTAGDLKTLTSGFLVSRIMNNTYSTIQGDSSYKDTKVYLYSGHDANVAGLLSFLDNFVPHNPNYGAHIIIEVHNISGTRYLKFLHENYQHDEPVPLKIPNCGIYCALETFMQLYAKHLDLENQNALCG